MEGQHTQGAVLTQPGDRCRGITHRCSHKQVYTEKTDGHTETPAVNANKIIEKQTQMEDRNAQSTGIARAVIKGPANLGLQPDIVTCMERDTPGRRAADSERDIHTGAMLRRKAT